MPSPVDVTLVVFTGPKGVGKSTAAAHLVQTLGFTEINFADKLKRICSEAYDIPLEKWYCPHSKDDPVPGTVHTLRTAMQAMGDYMRSQNPYFFAAAWEKAIQRCNNDRVVVSDLRMPEEYEAVTIFPHKRIIRILPPEDGMFHIKMADDHNTERNWNKFEVDGEVPNCGTIRELHANLMNVL